MGKLLRRPAAEDDLIEVWSYIASDSAFAADRFLSWLDDAFAMLAANPLAGQSRRELAQDLRSFAVANYVVFYQPPRMKKESY